MKYTSANTVENDIFTTSDTTLILRDCEGAVYRVTHDCYKNTERAEWLIKHSVERILALGLEDPKGIDYDVLFKLNQLHDGLKIIK